MPSTPGTERTVLSTRAIWISAAFILVIGSSATIALFWFFPPRGSRDAVAIVRTAATIFVGTGGGIGLLLAARRQQKVEEADRDRWHDAAQRRVTELQSQANEQLGHEKAAVRLGALTLLNRLGTNYVEYRQEIADILCAYLRMPFTHPGHADHDAAQDRIKEAHEELQVRMTAQRILADHLRPGTESDTGERAGQKFWEDVALDLTGATLIDLDMAGCRFSSGVFRGARFIGAARFDSARIEGLARFERASFDEPARFEDVCIDGPARFERARFNGWAKFDRARFRELAQFERAHFADLASFEHARFGGLARFERARFMGAALFGFAFFARESRFDRAHFTESARFEHARFEGFASFERCYSEGRTTFTDSRFAWSESSIRMRYRVDVGERCDTWPSSWTSRAPRTDAEGRIEGKEGVWGFVVPVAEVRPDVGTTATECGDVTESEGT